jgi:hypothetical protein
MKTREKSPAEDTQSPEVGSLATPGDQPASDPMASAIAAFQQLAALQRKKRQQEAPAQTFEDVVRELMRPMLENWLEGTVPGLVGSVLRPELRRAFEGR